MQKSAIPDFLKEAHISALQKFIFLNMLLLFGKVLTFGDFYLMIFQRPMQNVDRICFN